MRREAGMKAARANAPRTSVVRRQDGFTELGLRLYYNAFRMEAHIKVDRPCPKARAHVHKDAPPHTHTHVCPLSLSRTC